MLCASCESSSTCTTVWLLTFKSFPIFGVVWSRHTISNAWFERSVTTASLLSTPGCHRFACCCSRSCLKTLRKARPFGVVIWYVHCGVQSFHRSLCDLPVFPPDTRLFRFQNRIKFLGSLCHIDISGCNTNNKFSRWHNWRCRTRSLQIPCNCVRQVFYWFSQTHVNACLQWFRFQ